MSIYEQRLQADLDKINDQIKTMGELVQAGVSSATKAFLTDNIALANMTVISDNVINRKMRQIDHECHTFIARHLPSAGHLRLISSIIRLNIILERIGDYSVTISRESLQVEKLDDTLMTQIDLIANEAMQMLNQSLRSFHDRNAEMAKITMNISDHMEDTMDGIYGSLSEARQQYGGKHMFALFATLSQLKRITDQSKNICEEAIFVATGQTKETKTFNILFIDETNTLLSIMAEGIGTRHFSHCARFSSAGRVPPESPDQRTVDFLNDHGMSVNNSRPKKIDFSKLELSQFHVIVALQGSVKSYLEYIPFHTVFLDWDYADFPSQGNEEEKSKWYQQCYRELTHHITELMDLMYGEGGNSLTE